MSTGFKDIASGIQGTWALSHDVPCNCKGHLLVKNNDKLYFSKLKVEEKKNIFILRLNIKQNTCLYTLASMRIRLRYYLNSKKLKPKRHKDSSVLGFLN